jgi:DNA mismatch repair ATPase MutS
VFFATHFAQLASILEKLYANVVNLHLVTQEINYWDLKFLHVVKDGRMNTEHYGLRLAKYAGFPPHSLQVAKVYLDKVNAYMDKKVGMEQGILDMERERHALKVTHRGQVT